jgi:hypothetical protein
MATPEIQIEMDPGPWTEGEWVDYRLAGSPVSGRVRIRALEPVRCRGVIVSVGWHTEGKGDTDRAAVFEEIVHQGELSVGEHVFPFAAHLPDSPMSYTGKYIKIVWQVAARIDIALRTDPHLERTFFVTLSWQ